MSLRLVVLVLASLASACGAAVTSVPCGATTCGRGQYCRVTCTCCGTPGGTPSSVSECLPIPAGCDTVCGCAALQGGACTEAERLVEVPCA